MFENFSFPVAISIIEAVTAQRMGFKNPWYCCSEFLKRGSLIINDIKNLNYISFLLLFIKRSSGIERVVDTFRGCKRFIWKDSLSLCLSVDSVITQQVYWKHNVSLTCTFTLSVNSYCTEIVWKCCKILELRSWGYLQHTAVSAV